MAVSKRLRFEILRRDGHRCHYCGATAVEAALTVDHVTATALGGTDTPDNLVTACDPCNSGKSATPPGAALVADVQERHQEWRDAITATAEQDREQKEFASSFFDAWSEGNGGELPPGWKRTVDAYRQSGLAPHMWDEIVGIALTKPNVEDRFRYCCGVARNRVAQLHSEARAMPSPRPCQACAENEERDPIQDAIVDIWVNERVEGVSNNEGNAFSASVARALTLGQEDTHRLAEAALYAAWFGLTDIEVAAAQMDRDQIAQSWSACWYGTVGAFPTNEQQERVAAQIDALLKAARYNRSRIEFAAIHAGARRSTHLHFMLGDDELAASGEHRDFVRMLEAWSGSFQATSGRWPTKAESKPLWTALDDLPLDRCTWDDLRSAATMAAIYESADLRPCLMPFGDAFAAAELLLDPSA